MTISIGLIPNEQTVMLIQDAEATYQEVWFTQDILKKIKDINEHSVTGVIGSPIIANEVVDMVQGRPCSSSRELQDTIEQAYHAVRTRHLQRGILSKYGLNDVREVIAPPKDIQIDPAVREEVLNVVNNRDRFFSLDLMLAMNYDKPVLYTVQFPGVGMLENNIKGYMVSGSGSIMAIDRMGVELENYRWKKELTIDEGIDVLMKAGKVSEKHIGVGGPFEIVYITREQKPKIQRPNQKKINMIMYLYPLQITEETMAEAIQKMRDEKVSAEELAEHIKTHTNVGVEFDKYFKLNGN